MANILLSDRPYVSVGLDDYTYTVPATGRYYVSLQATEIPPSGLSIVIKNGVTTIYTAPAVTETQIALQFRNTYLFTAADVITIEITGSSADALRNNVKIEAAIGAGY